MKEAFNINNLTTFENSSNSLYLNPVIPRFYKTCCQIANHILKAFSLALELPENFFTTNHNQQNHTLRLLHYPALQQQPKPGQIRE